MELNLTKVGRALLVLALMLTALPMVADSVIIPIANNLYMAYPDQEGAVNFILSGPQLIIAIASLAAAPLMRFLGKKTLLAVFGVICAVSLLLPLVVDNAYAIAACRGVAGFSVGIINVVGLALIAEIFTDEKTYANLMGVYNAIMAIAGTIMSFLSGMIAVTNWKNAFFLYAIFAVCAVAFILFIPHAVNKRAGSQPDTAADVNLKEKSESKGGLGVSFWLLMIMLFLFLAAAMGASYFVSVYIGENALGDEALSGTATSAYSIGSFVFALAFGVLYGKLHRGINALALLMNIATIVILIVTRNPIAACVSMVLGGGSYGLAYAFALTHMPNIVPPSKVDTGMAIIGFVVAISSFLATYLITFLMGVFGSFTGSLPVLLGIGVAAIAFEVLGIFADRMQAKVDDPVKPGQVTTM